MVLLSANAPENEVREEKGSISCIFHFGENYKACKWELYIIEKRWKSHIIMKTCWIPDNLWVAGIFVI